MIFLSGGMCGDDGSLPMKADVAVLKPDEYIFIIWIYIQHEVSLLLT